MDSAAVKTKLILDSIEVWMLKQQSLVSGKSPSSSVARSAHAGIIL
jgi:hypothetical protein